MYVSKFIFIIYLLKMIGGGNLLGGYSNEKQMNNENLEAQEIANSVRAKVEEDVGPLKTFEVVLFKTQVVAGTNYKLKVKVDDDVYFHLKVFKPLPCYGTENELHEVTPGVKLTDPL